MTQRMIVGVLTAIVAFVLMRWGTGPRVMAGSAVPSTEPRDPNMKTQQATFAAGCFWGVEAAFRKVDGVVETQVGYTGGHLVNPSYRDVCGDETGHAEAVLVTFDPKRVSFEELLDTFWSAHDPTTMNRQGPDVGTQYRSAIFFHDAAQEKAAKASKKEVDDSHVFRRTIVTEIVPVVKFYTAEEYHQQYFEKKGMAESCHVGIADVHTKLAKDAKAARLAQAS